MTLLWSLGSLRVPQPRAQLEVVGAADGGDRREEQRLLEHAARLPVQEEADAAFEAALAQFGAEEEEMIVVDPDDVVVVQAADKVAINHLFFQR